MKNNPIGLFDSGVGGTSIWKEVLKVLPNESTIYLADSANAPYGEKDKQTIINLCIKNTELLLAKGCKIIIVACNTATTNAIDYLRSTYKVPFIGIEPAIKPAALFSKTGAIGILATKGTLASALFEKTAQTYTQNITTIRQDGQGLVPLVEKGDLESEEVSVLLKKYLQPMIDKNIDHLVLGCTHYPYLIPAIQKIIGNKVRIIDSGEAVARQTKAILTKNDLLASLEKPHHELLTNENKAVLESLVQDVAISKEITQIKF